VDIRDEALEVARSVGATHVLNARRESHLIEHIHDLTQGGAHVAIDALGSLETCRNAVLSLRKRGRQVQVGLMVADYKEAPIPMNLVIARELSIVGSHGMQAYAYGPMLDMIVRGKLRPAQLIRQTVTLEEGVQALMSMGDFALTGVTVIDRL